MKDSRETIQVAVVGTGFYGSGLIRRLSVIAERTGELRCVLAANRTLPRAVAALVAAGHEHRDIAICETPAQAERAVAAGRPVATSDLELAAEVGPIDAVVEATGDVEVGARIAQRVLEAGKHVTAANVETQATVGGALARLAQRHGVVYTDCHGDEPGIARRLWHRCETMGLNPVLAGNCKGVLKRYATPRTQAAYAREHGLTPRMATAAADGTKLAFEMTTLANAIGAAPAIDGMVGVTTTHETLLEDLAAAGLLERAVDRPVVDYVFGLSNGVFVVLHEPDPVTRREFRYLKLGDGPFYLLHERDVLIHYDAPATILEAVRHGTATIAPRDEWTADAIAYAKRNLHPGELLEGMGSDATYALVVEAERARSRDLLPMGLAENARLVAAVEKDAPVRYADVELPESVAVALRREQDAALHLI